MRSFKLLTTATFALFTLMFFASAATAQNSVPRYLHALSNLRMAREWIKADHRPNTPGRDFETARRHSIDEIDRAIHDIKQAVHDDGANSNFTPPPQVNANPEGPLRTALELLEAAHSDLAMGVDPPETRGLQVRSLECVAEARRTLSHLIGN
jgi:hypothetical protein